MLREVHFQSIRCLHDVRVDLGPLTVLVGPNGCGKSTLLDQIDNLCAMSHPDPDNRHTLGAPGDIIQTRALTQQRSRGTSTPMVWEGRTDRGLRLSVTVSGPRWSSWWNHTVVTTSNEDGTTDMIDGKQSGQESSDGRTALETNLELQYAWTAQRLSLNPARIAEPADVRVERMDRDGAGVPALLADLALNDQPAYARLQEDLRTIVPHFEKLQITRGEFDQGGTKLAGLKLGMFMRGAGLLPASEVSDGTRITLALLTATHNQRMPPLILMDDVDHGLHLRAQFALIQAIRQVMKVRPELQVVCTTHSPYLLDAVKTDEVRVMALDAHGHTVIRPLTEYPDLQKMRGLQTGEIWGSAGEGWVLNGE